MKNEEHDYIILGAGIYGLYIARKLALKYPNKKLIVLEYDDKPFQRASYINQARVHNGYHYPRSLSTALKSASYYERFIKDYSFAINNQFEKIYAVSNKFSYTSGEDFEKFCKAAHIPCTPINYNRYFKPNVVDSVFLTQESSLDAQKICDYFISELEKCKNVSIIYNAKIKSVEQNSNKYELKLENDKKVLSDFIINTTYASVNQILDLFGFEKFKIKYEIAEICLCNVTENILHAGLTVMDGPFFSVIPFGLSGYHSLSAVHFTPHKINYDALPTFNCQKQHEKCTPYNLENCNLCSEKPNTAWYEMKQLANKYFKKDIDMVHKKSLFAVKPILKASEISDSRPTIIKEFSTNPTFISVLSGKFNTMYDLDEILK